MSFKSGFISIVGRPNVGKSTLINKMIGHKISIVTNKAQTTRNNIRGILTKKDEYQMIFIDTPGVHTSKKELDRFMNASALKSMKDVDIVIFLVPADETIGTNDKFILKQLEKQDVIKFLVITKSDLVSKNELFQKTQEWNEMVNNDFEEIIIISSTKDVNVDLLKDLILKHLPENDYQFYDEDMVTDQPNRFAIREIIRENILFKTGQEIPHSVAILIDELEEDESTINIVATIVVERESQKSIIIGQKGSKIKDIKYKSRKELKQLYEKNIELDLFIKVKENWRNSPSLIKMLGYDKNKY
ncbi:GTP-binding protein Era [Williamsoniiplasma luminosum]|uniref:GTPase Era n=1 Tax=Williamsoniiplasma luminosum TaxID=214888 RepID=A0A2K8NU93_9MOLU|nr:GTPase Era [Williamsoniiplasma luminosum]ATZ17369.1 GTP-binding protein Era [Williamsoniiplasma luminosum]AVP49169.1 MAG: GTPase Era [Williamsoniiplasma luminosum]